MQVPCRRQTRQPQLKKAAHLEELDAGEFGERVGGSAVDAHGKNEGPPAHVEGQAAPVCAQQARCHQQPPYAKPPQDQPCIGHTIHILEAV